MQTNQVLHSLNLKFNYLNIQIQNKCFENPKYFSLFEPIYEQNDHRILPGEICFYLKDDNDDITIRSIVNGIPILMDDYVTDKIMKTLERIKIVGISHLFINQMPSKVITDVLLTQDGLINVYNTGGTSKIIYGDVICYWLPPTVNFDYQGNFFNEIVQFKKRRVLAYYTFEYLMDYIETNYLSMFGNKKRQLFTFCCKFVIGTALSNEDKGHKFILKVSFSLGNYMINHDVLLQSQNMRNQDIIQLNKEIEQDIQEKRLRAITAKLTNSNPKTTATGSTSPISKTKKKKLKPKAKGKYADYKAFTDSITKLFTGKASVIKWNVFFANLKNFLGSVAAGSDDIKPSTEIIEECNILKDSLDNTFWFSSQEICTSFLECLSKFQGYTTSDDTIIVPLRYLILYYYIYQKMTELILALTPTVILLESSALQITHLKYYLVWWFRLFSLILLPGNSNVILCLKNLENSHEFAHVINQDGLFDDYEDDDEDNAPRKYYLVDVFFFRLIWKTVKAHPVNFFSSTFVWNILTPRLLTGFIWCMELILSVNKFDGIPLQSFPRVRNVIENICKCYDQLSRDFEVPYTMMTLYNLYYQKQMCVLTELVDPKADNDTDLIDTIENNYIIPLNLTKIYYNFMSCNLPTDLKCGDKYVPLIIPFSRIDYVYISIQQPRNLIETTQALTNIYCYLCTCLLMTKVVCKGNSIEPFEMLWWFWMELRENPLIFDVNILFDSTPIEDVARTLLSGYYNNIDSDIPDALVRNLIPFLEQCKTIYIVNNPIVVMKQLNILVNKETIDFE